MIDNDVTGSFDAAREGLLRRKALQIIATVLTVFRQVCAAVRKFLAT